MHWEAEDATASQLWFYDVGPYIKQLYRKNKTFDGQDCLTLHSYADLQQQVFLPAAESTKSFS